VCKFCPLNLRQQTNSSSACNAFRSHFIENRILESSEMTEIARRSNVTDEYCTQALQTALELSMLNISGSGGPRPAMDVVDALECSESKSQNVTECVAVPSSEHVAELFFVYVAQVVKLKLFVPKPTRTSKLQLEERSQYLPSVDAQSTYLQPEERFCSW